MDTELTSENNGDDMDNATATAQTLLADLISLWQRRRKERGEPVIEEEDILVLQKST